MARDRSSEGVSSIGTLIGLAALLVVVLVTAIVVSLTLPSNSPSTTTGTTGTTGSTGIHGSPISTSTTAGASGTGGAAAAAACRSDVMVVQTALAAYQASNGAYPSPPAAWSAGSYPTNFDPLTQASAPGPFLKMPPADNHYVVLWDSAGHVWVEPPGTFTSSYDAGNDAADPAVCARVTR